MAVDHSALVSALKIAGVLVPLGLIAWVASHQVLASDGGINLQVSWSVATGHGFASAYDNTISPPRVQTSGYFVLLGALFIKLFGTSAFALQLTNLTFFGLLLAAISYALRQWPVLRIIGPLAFIVLTPGVIDAGLGGLGEGAVGFCMVAAFALVSAVAEGARRPLLLCAAASALLGISLTIKMITVAELPLLAIGYLVVAALRPDIGRRALAASTLCGLLPVIAFETYRASQFGSISGWWHYWSAQIHATGTEAAGSAAARADVSTPTGLSRFSSLGAQIGVHIPVLVVAWLVLPLVLVGVSYARRTGSSGEWLARPMRTLELLLAGTVAIYIPWYLFISPLDWLRHFEVAVIAVSVLYLLLAGRWLAARSARRASPATPLARGTKLQRSVAIAALGASLVCLLRFSVTNVHEAAAPDSSALNAERAVSDYVASMSHAGNTLCGTGLMSSPMISLTSRVTLCNLEIANPCAVGSRNAFDDGKVYLIWRGKFTLAHPVRPPATDKYTFTRIAKPSDYASIWRVSLRSDACPSR